MTALSGSAYQAGGTGRGDTASRISREDGFMGLLSLFGGSDRRGGWPPTVGPAAASGATWLRALVEPSCAASRLGWQATNYSAYRCVARPSLTFRTSPRRMRVARKESDCVRPNRRLISEG